jgi:hypothetical protein
MELTNRRAVRGALVAAGSLLAALALLVGAAGARAAEAPVGLGTADSFAVLAGTTVTNTGPTVLTGDVGVSPGSAVTGGPVVTGATHAADEVAAGAQRDLVTAYDDAAGRGPATAVSGDLVGRTLTPGVYRSTSSLQVTGTVTLDAQGDPQAVFVFQIASTLVTGSQSRVLLLGGGQACNVFWQVGSSATLGTGSQFTGSILALTSIAAQTGATVQGRLLARNGAVTLDSDTVFRPACAAPRPTPSGTAVPVPTDSTTPTAVPVPTVSATATGGPTPSVLPSEVSSTPVPDTSPGTALPVTGRRGPPVLLALLGAAALLLGGALAVWGRTATRA